jgi:hypothetical protein
MTSPQFTVDTHLFRELGALLVGRDSTALVELLKNAYDADATIVRVDGQKLDEPGKGTITVADNGTGMTLDRLHNAFLRIASRAKDIAIPASPRLHRRFTGSKGIGRLAAHKLAQILEIESIATDPTTNKVLEGFRAVIDWNAIESVETLTDIPPRSVQIERFSPRATARGGTTIILRKLRRRWTERERLDFVSEAQNTRPPAFLAQETPDYLLSRPLLFKKPRQFSAGSKDSEWELVLSGDFDVGEDYLSRASRSAAWVLEVDATAENVCLGICPTIGYSRANSEAKRRVTTLKYAVPAGAPAFQARILIREGDWDAGQAHTAAWRRSRASGVRLYLEGFRVLPYGEPGNDWLRLDRTYASRTRGGDDIAKEFLDNQRGELGDRYLSVLPARSYVGGAFVTLERAGTLEMLVNREGFLPNAGFYFVEEAMRKATDFATIVRSEAKASITEARRNQRLASAAKKYDAQPALTPARQLVDAVSVATGLVREAR